MDRMHEKAKLSCNTKHKLRYNCKGPYNFNNEQPKQPLTLKSCCYCHKAFFDSSYLLKHVIRRHSEDFLAVHKRCQKQESNNDNFDTKYIIDYIQAEFNSLRKDLVEKKAKETSQVKGEHSSKQGDTISPQSLIRENEEMHNKKGNTDTSLNPGCEFNKILNPINSATSVDKNRTSNATKDSNEIKREIQHLNDEFNRFNMFIEDKIFLKEDTRNLVAASESKILQIQNEKLSEFKIKVGKDLNFTQSKLHEVNMNCRYQFSELKQEMEGLAFIVDLIREKVNSPDHFKSVEKRLERNILKFLEGNTKYSAPILKSHHFNKAPRHSSKSNSLSYQNRTKDTLERDEPHNELATPVQSPSDSNINSRKTTPNKTKEFMFHDKQSSEASLKSDEISSIVGEKMLGLGMVPYTSKISSKDYSEKMKLLEDAKHLHSLRHHDFLNIYNRINQYAEQITRSKLQKKDRKLRFSEPLTSHQNRHKNNRKSKKQNQTYPFAENNVQSSFKSVTSSKHFNNPNKEGFESSPGVSILQENVQQQILGNTVHLVNDSFDSTLDTYSSSNHLEKYSKKSFLEPMHSTPLKEASDTPITSRDSCHVKMPSVALENYPKPIAEPINTVDKNKVPTSVLYDNVQAVSSHEFQLHTDSFHAIDNNVEPEVKRENFLFYQKMIQSEDKNINTPNETFVLLKKQSDTNLSEASSLESLSSWNEDDENLSV